AARAAASCVMAIPTGHHTIHRPQPTHPEEANWSYQVLSLWVIHCRYRLWPLDRTSPPCMYVKSREKQEAQTRHRSAWSPVRSVVCWLLVKKEVGQTMVQLPHVRHRPAASSRRGDSRVRTSSRARSTGGRAGPIRCSAAATAADASATTAGGAGVPDSSAS